MKNELETFLSNKRVLVTGGAGFIGSHLVETLISHNASVAVFDMVEQSAALNLSGLMPKLQYINGNICDYESFSKSLVTFKPELVLHLAANASVPRSSSEPLYDFEQNAKGTTVVLEAIRNIAPQIRVVVTSSGAVYGDPGKEPIKESDPLAPISPYGSSKYISEIQAGLYHRTFKISTSIARVFNCYGPRLPRFVVLDFLKKLEINPNHLEILGDGKQTRDFTFVSDTVAGILQVAYQGLPGEAYNIASGVSHDVISLAKTILGLRKLSNTELKFTGDSWPGDAQFWRVDISKARAIGYQPQIDLTAGLEQVLKWYDQRVK